MPKHHKPRRDYPDRPAIDPERPTIFAGDAFDRLCGHFDIAETERPSTQEQLERAADAYHRHKVAYDERPKPGETLAALAEIEELAGRLADRLDRMDPFTAGLLWHPEGEIGLYALKGKPSPYGHAFVEWPGPDGQTVTHYLGQDDITQAVRILESYARHAREGTPAGRGGRPAMVALRNWVANVALVWERLTGRPFTVDFHGGAPASDAAAFTWATVQILDPSVTMAQARTAMRAHVRKASERARKNRGKDSP